jgi:hypothetical protein
MEEDIRERMDEENKNEYTSGIVNAYQKESCWYGEITY